jgi:hypothetical protein
MREYIDCYASFSHYEVFFQNKQGPIIYIKYPLYVLMRKLFLFFFPILVLSCVLSITKVSAQTLKLGLLLEMNNLPAKQFTGSVVNKGVWQLESASADSLHIVFSPVSAADTYESIEIKRRPLLTISYYTQDKAWFDSLKREAIRLRFRLLNKETISVGETIHTLQKDSAFVVEFHQTPSSMEIHLFSFKDYFRSFFGSDDQIWSREEQYGFMEKCMSKMTQKLTFKYALKACGCGGKNLERQMKFKFVREMYIHELMLLIKPCVTHFEDVIKNQN